jgi:hypothetical protein
VDYSYFGNRTRNSVFRKFPRLFFPGVEISGTPALGDVQRSFYAAH